MSVILVTPGDPAAIAAALEALALDPERHRRFGEAVRATVEADQDIRVSASRLVSKIQASLEGTTVRSAPAEPEPARAAAVADLVR